MIAETATRVPQHTPSHINRSIRHQIQRNIERYRQKPHLIPQRMEELDREWDIERSVEAISAGLTLTGLALTIGVSRKWLALPIVVQLFMLQHSLQGWCPPLMVLRRMGVRTAREIEDERHALRQINAQHKARSGTIPPVDV